MPHWPQAAWSWFSGQHPQAWRWLPVAAEGFIFSLVKKELFTVAKILNLLFIRTSICSGSWVIPHTAKKNLLFALPSPFQKEWPLCKLKEQSRHTKCFQNPPEYREMCQLFRREDYPAVYGTNTIPKFLLGQLSGLLAHCESFRNNFTLHFQESNKTALTEISFRTRCLMCLYTHKTQMGNLLKSLFGF